MPDFDGVWEPGTLYWHAVLREECEDESTPRELVLAMEHDVFTIIEISSGREQNYIKMDVLVLHVFINLLSSLASTMDGVTRTIRLLNEQYFVSKSKGCGVESLLISKRWLSISGRFACSGPKVYITNSKKMVEKILKFMKLARSIVHPGRLPTITGADLPVHLRADGMTKPAPPGWPISFPCPYNSTGVVGAAGWNWCGCVGEFASAASNTNCSPRCEVCIGRPWWQDVMIEHNRQEGQEVFFMIDKQGWD